MENQNETRSGYMPVAIWLVLALGVSVLAAAAIGMLAYESEEGGVMATMVAAPFVGAAWSGAFAAAVIWLTRQEKTVVRLGIPFGCAILGGILLLILVVVFFAVIFPAL